MASDKKRREPQEVAPVEAGGLRYEAPLAGVPYGYAQDGGILIARDAVSGALVWSQRLYVVAYDGSIEDDKQEVYITSLTLSGDGRALLVINERGEHLRVGLVDRAVERLESRMNDDRTVRRLRGAFTLAALAASIAVASAAPGADKKRREPPEVPPLVVGGLRYEAPLLGQPFGYAQDGGIVVARRVDGGALEWTRRIYDVPHDPAMEGDKQDVFIAHMKLSADRKRLVIDSESGLTFELNLDGSGLQQRR